MRGVERVGLDCQIVSDEYLKRLHILILCSKKSKVQALGLAKPIVEGLLPIGCEDDPEDAEDDSPSRVSTV
jgi:hypothetical protein